MGAPEYKSKSNIPEERVHRVSITGTGAGNPTRRAGPGVTVTRTGAGVYKFTFAKNPGTFVGIGAYAFRADTPGDLKGYSLVGDTPVAAASGTDASIEVTVFDATNTAADLAAAQYLDITFVFAAQSVIA